MKAVLGLPATLLLIGPILGLLATLLLIGCTPSPRVGEEIVIKTTGQTWNVCRQQSDIRYGSDYLMFWDTTGHFVRVYGPASVLSTGQQCNYSVAQ